MRHVSNFLWTLALVGSGLSTAVGVAAAQGTGNVQGTVTDVRSTKPLRGAQVQVVGTRLTAVTDDEGRFRITVVPVGTAELRITRIGYRPTTRSVTITLGGEATEDFQLASSPLELEGIVVTATGEQLRREVGNAIAQINVAEDVEQSAITNIADLVTGRAAGVQVMTSGGTTGSGTRIRIRGSNSVSLRNDPVIYVDGVRVSNTAQSFSLIGGSGGGGRSLSVPLTGGDAPSRLNDIDPEQIESIEIIKGPAASTLYGTEAANGVIWITTKRGRVGAARWNASFEAGSVVEPNTYPTNFRGFDASGNFCFLTDVAAGTCQQAQVASFNPLENPSSSPFRTGDRQSYSLDVSGGGGGFTYFLAGRYTNEDGVLPVNGQQKANLRANFSFAAGDKLDFNISSGYVSSDLALPLNGNFALGTITNGMSGFWSDTLGAGGFGEFSPDQLFTVETTQNIDRYTNSISANWTPNDFLVGRANVGIDLTNRVDDQFFPTGEAPAFLGYDLGARFSNRFQNFVYTADLGLTATSRVSSSMTSRTTVGAQYIQQIFRGTFATGRQLVAGSRSIAAAAVSESGEETRETITVGAFVEEQIGLRERLYLTAAVRVDDNSSFGRNFGAVAFPKFSASWVISEESFFPLSFLSTMRLRAAWGESGVQPGTNDALRFFTPIAVTADGQDVTGVTFGGLGNPSLEPERSREFEVGLDAQLWSDRVGLEVTYYDKRTRDALVFRQLPPSLGVSAGRFENLGSVSNTGFEALISAKLVDSRFASWDVTLNGSTNNNELQSLGEGIEPIILGTQRHVEGYPLGGYWDRPIVSFGDANGDGIIAPSEVVVGDTAEFLGVPFPKRSLSIQSGISIRDRVRISGLLDFRGGYTLLNGTASWRIGQNTPRELNDPTSSLEDQARGVARKFDGTVAGYVEDADFWKLRELSVTFLAPNSWARALRLARWRLTLSGRNLFTITDYSGMDPEAQQLGQSNFVTSEFMAQPPVRYWTARVNVSF